VNAKKSLIVLAGLAVLAAIMNPLVRRDRTVSGPGDVCELARTCDRLRLFWTTGSTNMPEPIKGYSSLTIATDPISAEQAATLGVGQPPEQWRGRVRAYSGKVWLGETHNGVRRVAWGKLTLIGDPELIERLVGQR
jgi:hypothetical protein